MYILLEPPPIPDSSGTVPPNQQGPGPPEFWIPVLGILRLRNKHIVEGIPGSQFPAHHLFENGAKEFDDFLYTFGGIFSVLAFRVLVDTGAMF